MPCTEPTAARRAAPPLLLAAITLLCTACSHAPEPVSPTPPAPVARTPARTGPTATEPGGRLAAKPAPAPAAAPARRLQRPARQWDEYQLQAAERLVEANPGGTYGGPVPEPLLAIPVLEIELNADGSVRRIHVMRKPTQALDTVQLAIAAVQRAAPFGPVAHLPKPWKFTEVFLFDEQRKFKPRTLDL